jgi:GMP synthase-like glutamine amidotransferase
MKEKINNILILNLCDLKDTLHVLEFVRPVELIVKKHTLNYEIKHYLESINFEEYSHIILCGVALKDFNYIKNLDKFDWIKNYAGNLLGICAGSQLLSQVHGNSLSECQEIGLQKVDLVENDFILKELNFPLEIYGLHNKGFESLNKFKVLLKSNEVVELIKHETRNHYGCLFHPEVRNTKLIENFINL